ncbi:Vesicle transport protein USE1 [Carex littledalei]|uniref:Vesicle transport protein USE1 n=1 Tax=Carex littledalei TaxID=544730 RepID=A0A833RLZ9_9POAL|nr:Vesicle transport protein USE1 [Carex littledalei]
MGISKTEVNLRRLLAAAPNQQNQTKLIHLISSPLLVEYSPFQNLILSLSHLITSVPKAKLKEYSEAIEALATKLASIPPVPVDDVKEIEETKVERISSTIEQASNSNVTSSSGLRRRTTINQEIGENGHESKERETGAPIRLDAEAQVHIEKHRKLQEDLTDEMVGLARQLKESSLVMSQSLQDTGKILDSTERAVEHSLASTGRANVRAMEVYSKTSKTTCFTWLLMFFMTCIFVMVVLLIRVT